MTNPAYETTNSDVEKLIASIKIDIDKRKSMPPRGDANSNIERLRVMNDTMKSFSTESVEELIATLEQAQQYSKKRDEENQDLMLTIGRLRVEREQLEAAPNGMMQLSNELAEMKRKCVELENQKFDTAKLINKFYTRYPLESFKSDPERAETLGYYMAGAEVQHFGDFVVYEMPEDDEGSE